jgi:hypothetical protein
VDAGVDQLIVLAFAFDLDTLEQTLDGLATDILAHVT